MVWPLVEPRLVMAKPEGHKDPSYLSEIIRRENITTLHFVPSMLRAIVCEGRSDQVHQAHGHAGELRRLLEAACRLFIEQGFARTSVDETSCTYMSRCCRPLPRPAS